jgi:lysozyme family protein
MSQPRKPGDRRQRYNERSGYEQRPERMASQAKWQRENRLKKKQEKEKMAAIETQTKVLTGFLAVCHEAGSSDYYWAISRDQDDAVQAAQTGIQPYDRAVVYPFGEYTYSYSDGDFGGEKLVHDSKGVLICARYWGSCKPS